MSPGLILAGFAGHFLLQRRNFNRLSTPRVVSGPSASFGPRQEDIA